MNDSNEMNGDNGPVVKFGKKDDDNDDNNNKSGSEDDDDKEGNANSSDGL